MYVSNVIYADKYDGRMDIPTDKLMFTTLRHTHYDQVQKVFLFSRLTLCFTGSPCNDVSHCNYISILPYCIVIHFV